MGSTSILRTISMVLNLMLIHMAISDGFLYNYLGIVLLRSSRTLPNYTSTIRIYYVQLVLHVMFILGLVYLLVGSFVNGFLTFTNLSKYIRQPITWIRLVFLNIIPLVILISMAAFALLLYLRKLHYAPGRELYHTPPDQYKSSLLAENEFSHLIRLLEKFS